MKLFYRKIGEGEPLVILHGLYGSSDNWMSIAREFSLNYRVTLVDQRNHGQSPHCQQHTYQSMCNDLLELFHVLDLKKVILLGHSMGGKVAMLFANQNPNLVKLLIIVDISPASYINSQGFSSQVNFHKQIIAGLLSIDAKTLSSRSQADELLEKWVKETAVRHFLLKNLKREPNGGFRWQLNLEAISENLIEMMESVFSDETDAKIGLPTLFIKGENSPYINGSHKKIIDRLFANYQIITIANAGHWVHAEQPELFIKAIRFFLNKKVD